MKRDEVLEVIPVREGMPEGHVCLLIRGHFVQPHVKKFRFAVERLLKEGFHHIEVDLSQTDYIDTSGLVEFLPAYQTVKEANGTLKLTNPRRLVRHILTSTNLEDILEIGPSMETQSDPVDIRSLDDDAME